MGKEREDARRIQIGEIEFRNSLAVMLGDKPEEQDDTVPVAEDRVGTASSKAGEMIAEVVTDDGAEEVNGRGLLHRNRPFLFEAGGMTNVP
jgi:hypothetical protein